MTILQINIELLIKHKLSMEAYLILYALKNDKSLISKYVNNCRKIPTDIFEDLKAKGFISFDMPADRKLTLELLSLTTEGKSILSNRIPSQVDSQFDEFRTHYPKSVLVPGRQVPRRLHNDLERCRKLYNNLMVETTHEILCKAADLYYKEKMATNSLMYMQDLATWLHQKNYQQYLEDIEKSSTFTIQPNFTDDI